MLSEEDKKQQEEIQQEQERLKSLKESGDYKTILARYVYLPDFKKDEPEDPLKSYCYELLKNELNIIATYLRNQEYSVKTHAINFLGDVDNRESLLSLVECLLSEKDSDILSRIKDVLCKSENLDEIKDFFINSIESTSGDRFERLAEIISLKGDHYFLKDIIIKLKYRCPIGHKKCGEDIIPSNSFFVGHQFSQEKKDDLRKSINDAVEQVVKECTPYYADNELRQVLFCKICNKIQSTRFGIYDISKETDKGFTPNPNVMLELGLSLAFSKTTIIIMKAGQEAPSDLKWADIIFYESYKKLEGELIKKLPNVLGISN